MAQRIRACADVVPEHGDFEKMARYAMFERRDNLPDGRFLSNFAALASIPTPEAAVLLTSKKWQPGRILRTAFLDGEPEWKQNVKTIIHWWRDSINLHHTYTENPDEAEIRITFSKGGSWSYLGTDNLTVSKDEPTLQLGWLSEYDYETPEGWAEWRRVVLHEIAHTYDYAHEQSSPAQSIPWDTEKVYEYYETTQGWSRDQVYNQVLKKYSTQSTQYSTFDPKSIMQYPVPNELTIGDFEIGWNITRSETDKRYGRLWYP